MRVRRSVGWFIFAVLAILLLPGTALGVQETVLIDEPPEYTALREKYQNMTVDEIEAAGFEIEPMCVSADMLGLPAELGAMGYHAINMEIAQTIDAQGEMDEQSPGVLLLDADMQVVGLEWEAADLGQPVPGVFGQKAEIIPGHPGREEPHYILHSYFRSNGKVLFSTWDPQLSCPDQPTPQLAPASGGPTHNDDVPVALMVSAMALLAAGVTLRAAQRRESRS